MDSKYIFMESLKQDINESTLSRIWKHLKSSESRTIGFITAFRGVDESGLPLTIIDNKKRNRLLEQEIRSAGFGFIKLKGHYVEDGDPPRKVKEDSFLVVSEINDNGKLKGFLKKQGERFNQDSVLYKEPSDKEIYVLGTSKTAKPGYGKLIPLGKFKTNKISDYYSELRNGKKFMFEDLELPLTPSEHRLKKVLGELESPTKESL